MTSQVDGSREVVIEQAEKKITEINRQEPSKHMFLTTALSKRLRSHKPRTISEIIHHFPLMTSRFLSFELLEVLVQGKNDSCLFLINDTKEVNDLFPVQFSPSLDLALVATLIDARYAGKVSMLVVPSTTVARKLNYVLQTAFGSQCKIATTISSLTQEVSCELFADAQIILCTPGSLLRKLLIKDLPSVQSMVFYQPVSQQNRSLLTAYLFDVLLLRLQFTFRKNKSLRKLFFCDPQILSSEGYQMLTGCSNSFSIGPQYSSIDPSFIPVSGDIYKYSFIPMLGLLYRRHLTRKQLFTEMRSSYLFRCASNYQYSTSQEPVLEQVFDKQLYKAFLLLSSLTLGPFQFIARSNNRYTLTPFGEEFLTTVTYSSAELADIIQLILFLSSSMKVTSLTWDSLLEYLRKSFPVDAAYRYNQSFNQLVKFIQQVQEQFTLINESNSENHLSKMKAKLSKLLHSKNFSYGDFQNLKLLSSIGQRFASDFLTESLQTITEQMQKSFFSQQSKRKKNALYNQQKARELILTEVLSNESPQTASQVALALHLNRNLTDRILRSFAREEDPLIVSKTVLAVTGQRAFFGSLLNFPEYFNFSCSKCQFYTTTGVCSVFSTLGKLAPHKTPYEYRSRTDRSLKPGTVPCRYFSSKTLRRESYTLEAFGDLTRVVQGLTDFGAAFTHKCLYCTRVVEAFGTNFLPQIGTSTISCSNCGSLFKLVRSKNKKKTESIVVKCQEGNLNAFVNVLYTLSGMIWDDYKSELVPAHGMTIRFGEKVSLEGDYLIIENIRKKITELEYLYSSVPLAPEIVTTLEQKGVYVRFNPIAFQFSEQDELILISNLSDEQVIAQFALRISCVVNNSFLYANICSRWAVTIQLFGLLAKKMKESINTTLPLVDFEWTFLDILLLSRNVHHAFTSRLCEGLAGNLMWEFLKEVFSQENLDLFSRTRDRYVPEREFYPDKRTLAYSPMSALANFFLLLVQDHLIALHLQVKLPWKGSAGLVHGTKKTSALDERGFFLDFIDTIKITALFFIAQAVATKTIGLADVEEIISPSGAILYAVRKEAIPKLELLVEQFFSEKVYYASQTVALEEAYKQYLQRFFQLLDKIAITLGQITIRLEENQQSALTWLEQWEELLDKDQAVIVRILREKLSPIIADVDFTPFSYLPVFLRGRFRKLLTHLPSLEDFDIYFGWEKQVLFDNDIKNFLYRKKEVDRRNSDEC